MPDNRKIVCLFLLLFGVKYSKTNPAMAAVEIFSAGLELFNFISDQLEPSPTEVKINQLAQLDKIFSDITATIEESTQRILFSIQFESHLSEFRQVIRVEESLRDYLKSALQAKDMVTRGQLISQYCTVYDSSSVTIDQIDSVIIGGGSSSFSKSLLELVSGDMKCSVMDLNNFRNVSMKLVSGGMALQLGYNLFKNFSKLYNTTEEKWASKIETMVKAFDDTLNKCILKFPEMAKEDFKTIKNDTVLAQIFRRRYSDKTTDVLRISQPYIYNTILYYLYYDKNDLYIFVEINVLRLAISSERTPVPKLTQRSLQIFDQQTKSVCSGGLRDVMYKIQGVVQYMLTWNPSPVTARLYLLFVYNSSSSTKNTLNLDDDSPATMIDTHCMDIKLLMYIKDAKSNNTHPEIDNGQKSDTTPRFPSVLTLIVSLLVALG